MKVIDLYNIIVEGKVPPKKISYNGLVYVWDENKYLHFNDEYSKECCLLEGLVTEMCLNDYVEIIEDKPKKIEKIMIDDECIKYLGKDETRHYMSTNRKDREIYIPRINWLIDNMNYLLEKSDKE